MSAGFEPPASATQDTITISAEHLDAFDSAGALALLQHIDALEHAGNTIELAHFDDGQNELLRLVKDKQAILEKTPPPPPPTEKKGEDFIENLGREAVHKFHQCDGLLILVGDLTNKIFLAMQSSK